MSLSRKMVPSGNEVLREAIIVLAGAVIAAAVMYQFPSVKAWIKNAWE